VCEDNGGLLYQAVARSPHTRRGTLSYRINQRDNGAAGFGAPILAALWSAHAAALAVMEDDLW
jgi:hypothetical protein